jgi:RecB family exonuclease
MDAEAGGPTLLARFSPSTVNALASCPLRVGLLRAGRAGSRPNPFTALGNVAHAMHEMGWKGAFQDIPQSEIDSALVLAWDRLCAEQYAKLKAVALGNEAPPEPPDWPGFELTRARTLRRIKALSGPTPAAVGSGWVKSELSLHDDSSGLEGRIDRLQRRDGELRIIDLKSGVWQDEVSPEQRRQLLLYAALVHASLGEWADVLVIETAAGRETRIDVDRREVLSAVVEARGLVHDFNRAAESGWAELEKLAQPSDDTCRRCPARLPCEPYWMALTSDWRFHGSARGKLAERLESGDLIAVAISTESPRDRKGARTLIYRVANPGELGGTLAVVGAEQRGEPGTLRVRWDTQMLIC